MSGVPSFPCREVPGGCVVNVLVSAGSSRSGVRSLHGDALKVAVRSAPEKGRANAEVEAVLADFLGVARKQVRVTGGIASRRKSVRIAGLTASRVQACVAAWAR